MEIHTKYYSPPALPSYAPVWHRYAPVWSLSTVYSSDEPSAPLEEKAAEGNTTLDQKQVAAVLGTPVPIVFCRRVTRGSITSGGVLISPPATECRFENDASNTLTAYYRLLLSEGRLAGVQIRDVFQVSCRVGSHAQAYNGPAGSWIAGNAMVNRAGFTMQECPTVCGGGGSYLDISSLSFQCSYPNEDTTWDRQVHVFLRSGTEVSRLLDGVTGPSNNLADLMLLALKRSSRVPDRLIDTTSLLAAARFLDVNGLWFDCIIEESYNLQDYIYELAPFFLLRPTRSDGKYGLKPLLPTTSTGAINTGTIDWSWQFTENELLDRFEIDWVSLVERRPYCSVMTWRQQPDDDLGLIRTVEYRSNRLAENGPYESTDLSAFCTTENHAVKVAAYNQARRSYVTHTLGITIKPGPWSADLSQGDIVRVTVPRRTTDEGTTWHDYLYEVGEVSYGNDGEVGLSLIHFPVNSTGKSIVALAVANAVGTGTLLSTGRTGPSCDTNSSSSTSALSVATKQGVGSYEGQTINNENEQQEGDPGGTDEDPTDIKDGGGSGDPVNGDDPVDDPDSSSQVLIIDSATGEIVPITNPFPRVTDSQGNLQYPTGIKITRSAWSAVFPGGGSSQPQQIQVFSAATGSALVGANYKPSAGFTQLTNGLYGPRTCGFTLAGWTYTTSSNGASTSTGTYVYNAYPAFSPLEVAYNTPSDTWNSDTVYFSVEPVITYELIY